MTCEIYISEDKDQFKVFESHRSELEAQLGSDLEWMELPNRKASRIKQSADCDLNDKDAWPEYFAWLLYRATSFPQVIRGTEVRRLKLVIDSWTSLMASARFRLRAGPPRSNQTPRSPSQ
jgi:Domain of unknown function (DUF4268)